ncbi:L-ascorbate oxidase-like [Harmonia axyridis]|uniref:L-ascorbate oxidase-like n=1 Tax=Harmonia axyridis TaxID=115357 RepID=UPI001E279995|nr:L-ascorbate oxidase-like [Harmonia axyridis]
MSGSGKSVVKFEMSSSSAIMPRLLIVLGMVAAVVTILYFTPMPDHTFKSCDRPCHALDWPMICRIQLTIEMYQTMSGVCKDCPKNTTDCNNQFCATADGQARGIITANRQIPGPPIHVCHNDIMVIDVINKIPGHSLEMHWRGQPQNEAPFMDGVPMITQCPINSYTNFQYRFRASSPGTHLYHAFADSDRADGLAGALIVRQSDKLEPHRKLYDEDLKEHVVMLSEWSGDLVSEFSANNDVPKSILINGKTVSEAGTGMSIFNVKMGRRYRFRLAYASGNFGCPMVLSIQDHLLKVIALDGKSIKPHEASSIKLNKGERLDFVLKTDQNVGKYLVKVVSHCRGHKIEGSAVLNYEVSPEATRLKERTRSSRPSPRNFDTAYCSREIGKVCTTDVAALDKMPEALREVNRRIYLNFDYVRADERDDTFVEWKNRKYRVNNISFTFPPSPIFTQPEDVPFSSICNELKTPRNCERMETCECVHVEHIPLGAKVEIILLNSGEDDQEFIFHLHGYHFYIVGYRNFDFPINIEEMKALEARDELFKRNLLSPVLKDTVRLPRNSSVALRFLADNPGFWMLRDEQSKGYTRGMDIVFQVGSYRDMVPPPSGFPSCGSFVGPDFFLI